MKYDFLCIMLSILIMATAFSPFSYASKIKYSEEPLIAYKAKVIPNIDGRLSEGEWNDTKPYVYKWENGSEGSSFITSGMLAVTVCLKYDKNTLYILFTINDDEMDDKDSLDIFPGPSDEFVLVVYANGTGYEGVLTKSGVLTFPDSPKIDGEVACSYVNNVYTFEVSLNLTHYFNLTENNRAPLNIGYTDWYPVYLGHYLAHPIFGAVVSIGHWSTTEPGIFISSEYYTGNTTIYDIIPDLYNNSSNEELLIAYKAKVIPNIDGVLSQGEWNDTKPYVYKWENGGLYYPITSGMLAVTVCLKYDKNTLYILFTINDDEMDDEDSLYILPKNFILVLYANGTGYEFSLTKRGVVAYRDYPKIDGEAACSYVNNVYTFEVSLNLTHYFNLTENNRAPLNIGYTDGHPWIDMTPNPEAVVSVGWWGTAEPGIFISSEYYTGNTTIYDIIPDLYNNSSSGSNEETINGESSYLLLVVGTACISVIAISVIIWRFKRAKRKM